MRTRVVALLLAMLVSFPAFAEKSTMDKAPVVRSQINWRNLRSELMPRMGVTLNDAYFRNFILSLGYNYHATNWLSFGANVGWAFPIKTGLTKNVEDEKSEIGKSFAMPATHLGLVADAHLGVTPLFGKFLLFGNTAVAYDVHFNFGAGVLQVRWNSELPTNFEAEDTLAFGPALGGGIRLFVDRGVAVSIDIIDYVVESNVSAVRQEGKSLSDCQARPLDCYTVGPAEWTHNVTAMISFGIMMPYDLTYEE